MAIQTLGDLKPSPMLRKMRRLRTKAEHESMLFQFSYLNVLPAEVSNILVVMEEASLGVFAKKADKILDQRLGAGQCGLHFTLRFECSLYGW